MGARKLLASIGTCALQDQTPWFEFVYVAWACVTVAGLFITDCRTINAITADNPEPIRTPIRTEFMNSSDGNAREPINRLIVKPIPVRQATP